jgi:hypothetical protein
MGGCAGRNKSKSSEQIFDSNKKTKSKDDLHFISDDSEQVFYFMK